MAISIDRVYQKVLALANKEQRGYITPQEFNLFADHAQMEIFEQYFYDLDQFSKSPSSSQVYADKVKNLREKIDLFNKYSPRRCEVINDSGWLNLYDHVSASEPGKWGGDLYRIGRILINYKELASRKGIGASSGVEAQYSSISEQQPYSNSKLLDPFKNTTRYNTPTYYQLYYGDVYGFSHRERIQKFPYIEQI